MTTLDQLIPDAAMRTAGAEAIVGLTHRLTWEELERQSASVAAFLRDQGVGRGDRVAVSLHKDAPAYAAVHGVLRAGAVVVPIDPFGGALLGRRVLEEAEVSAIIGAAASFRRLEPWAVEGISLRTMIAVGDGQDHDRQLTPWDTVLAGSASGALPSPRPDDPAYVIFTSGSTGRPKGILHTHGSAIAYAQRAVAGRGLGPADRVAGMSAFHFDMSTLELYAAPLAAATVVAMSERHIAMPADFVRRSADERVTVWYTVPSFLRQVLARGGLEHFDLRSLRLVAFGGEPLPAGPGARLMRALPDAVFANIYGPAEVNECTNHVLDGPPSGDDGVPIGLPWDGVELAIDNVEEPIRPGTEGELLVSAPTAMAGYWRQPELTDRVLIPRADGKPPWYRTGDIVVADTDGILWFKGRKDHQVKLRGIRIELEAVENVLSDAPGVIHAVAGLDRPGSETATLVAAIVVNEIDEPSDRDLTRWCATRLPQVAVPRRIERRVDMPLTATGKVDRRRVRRELGLDGNSQEARGHENMGT